MPKRGPDSESKKEVKARKPRSDKGRRRLVIPIGDAKTAFWLATGLEEGSIPVSAATYSSDSSRRAARELRRASERARQIGSELRTEKNIH